MEQKSEKNNNIFLRLFRSRILIISVSFLIILFAAVFTVWSVSTPLKKIHRLNVEYGTPKKGKLCYKHPALEKDVKEIAYLEAFNDLAKLDSIGLIINLSDSLALLTLKGVVLHRANIKSISTDGFFKSLDICSYQNLFSSPLEITEQSASIEKEPIVFRKAPKSEEEASTSPYFPDTLRNKKVANIELGIQTGFRIYIHDGNDGCEKVNESSSTPGEIWNNIKRLFFLKKPEYQPAIHICMERNDAMSIYRALPTKAMIVMKM